MQPSAALPSGAPLRLLLIRPGTWAPPAPGEPLGGLTPAGRAQARACGRWLRSVAVPLFTAGGFDVVSSPARQARQTAELLGLGPWVTNADLSGLPAGEQPFAAGAYPPPPAAAELPRLTRADLRQRVGAWLTGPSVAGASVAAVLAVCPIEVLLAVRDVVEGRESDSLWLPGPCDVLAYSRLAPDGSLADRYRWRAWVPQPWSAPPGWNEDLWAPII
jgi:hypothetical protein